MNTIILNPVDPAELEIIEKILHELRKAEYKHPNWPQGQLCKQVAIVSEEAGEVAKAVLQYEDESGSLSEIEEELLQTAAMCIRMLKNLR